MDRQSADASELNLDFLRNPEISVTASGHVDIQEIVVESGTLKRLQGEMTFTCNDSEGNALDTLTGTFSYRLND